MENLKFSLITNHSANYTGNHKIENRFFLTRTIIFNIQFSTFYWIKIHK